MRILQTKQVLIGVVTSVVLAVSGCGKSTTVFLPDGAAKLDLPASTGGSVGGRGGAATGGAGGAGGTLTGASGGNTAGGAGGVLDAPAAGGAPGRTGGAGGSSTGSAGVDGSTSSGMDGNPGRGGSASGGTQGPGGMTSTGGIPGTGGTESVCPERANCIWNYSYVQGVPQCTYHCEGGTGGAPGTGGRANTGGGGGGSVTGGAGGIGTGGIGTGGIGVGGTASGTGGASSGGTSGIDAGNAGTGGNAGQPKCPATPPTQGTACNGLPSGCSYQDCAGIGHTDASCSAGAWVVSTSPCRTSYCGPYVCQLGQICFRNITGGEQYNCIPNGCGTGPISCACLGISPCCTDTTDPRCCSVYALGSVTADCIRCVYPADPTCY